MSILKIFNIGVLLLLIILAMVISITNGCGIIPTWAEHTAQEQEIIHLDTWSAYLKTDGDTSIIGQSAVMQGKSAVIGNNGFTTWTYIKTGRSKITVGEYSITATIIQQTSVGPNNLIIYVQYVLYKNQFVNIVKHKLIGLWKGVNSESRNSLIYKTSY